MKRFALPLVLLFCALPLFAQQETGLEKGFAPNKFYDLGELDSINTLNGNLSLNIAIGPSYPINGGLSYSLRATYNSKIWDYEGVSGQMSATPNRRSNAGVGWLVSLGRLILKTNPTNDVNQFIYESPDGNDHIFFDNKLHTDEAANTVLSTGVTAVGYTRDGSYLRLLQKSDNTFDVEHPDGTVSTFSATDGLLKQIHDRYNNSVTLTVVSPVPSVCSATDSFAWVLTDSKSARTNTICFASSTYPSS
ncbi:MAG TPA: hypothetical protein VFN10_03675, partial [Thermoanaerobaculia bacterium]|nr:hypothetical protein [Thermoanaerobaculia bacterium]